MQATELSAWVYSNNLDIAWVSEIHFSHGNISKIANSELFNVDRARIGNNGFSDATGICIKRWFNVTSINIPTLNYIEAKPLILTFPIFQNYL